MTGATSLQFTYRAQSDIRRISTELADLQRQVASGRKADDLAALGDATTPVLSANALMASLDARKDLINQLGARLDIQALSLRKAAEGAQDLALEIRTAVSAGDGRGIATAVQIAFNSITQAMNETWGGQPMFAGERTDVSPVSVTSVAQLAAAPSVQSIFDESAREQTIDVGDGLPVQISAKASTLATGAYTALRDLQALITASGGTIGQPISTATQTALLQIVTQLEASATTFTNEEARIGQLQKPFDADRVKLTQQSDLLANEVDKHVGSDLAQVSIKLNVLMAQYQATAKTFSDLSKLRLLDYL